MMSDKANFDKKPYGVITALSGDILHGWALNPEIPEQRLAVEIYIDNQFVTLARADMEQIESDHILNDGFHGFAVQLRVNWLESAHSITARIANDGPWLDGAISLPDIKRGTPAPISTQVWYSGSLIVSGWAWNEESPAAHVVVRVREGERFVCESVANRLHPALVYRESADHGFKIELPWSLADGLPHELHIETESGLPLTGSPINLLLHPEGLTNLLLKLWPESLSDLTSERSSLELLTKLSKSQDLLLPRSAGFSCYPEWYALFESSLQEPPNNSNVLILIKNDGSEHTDLKRSLTSIDNQLFPKEQIVIKIVNSDNFFDVLSDNIDRVDIFIPLNAGDRLHSTALTTISNVMIQANASWVYSDCDQDTMYGTRSNPWLKPAWDETLFFGLDIITPGIAVSKLSMKQALSFLRQHFDDKCTWPWILASIVAVACENVRHIPKVLYHRSLSAPANPELVPVDVERQYALKWLANLKAPGADYVVSAKYPALGRVLWPLPEPLPRVSLIIPTRDQFKLLRACVDSLLATDYPNLEIIIVDNDSKDVETLSYFYKVMKKGVRVLNYPYPFNYSAINNWAVKYAEGSVLGLVNNDIEAIDSGWLKEMVSHLMRENVGAVGAKLIWPNGMVQHGGVVVGINGLAAHTGNQNTCDDAGYLAFNQVAREQSAVTAACLLVHRDVYEKLNGLEEHLFPVAFNDVDFCLRLRQLGCRIVWTPFAVLIHAESASRGKEDTPAKMSRARREQNNFISRWKDLLLDDPYYNPCLAGDYVSGPYGGLATPPRVSSKLR